LTDNYGRSIQLGASRRRYEDALALQGAGRWNGAIYLGGYAIECSLKALICYTEGKNTLTETRMCEDPSVRGNALHNLDRLLDNANLAGLFRESSMKKEIALDRTSALKNAWKTVRDLWKKDERRYGDKLGDRRECERFMKDVKVLYQHILERQKEFL